MQNKNLKDYRMEIDELDEKIVTLFLKRLGIVNEIAEFKLKNNISVLDVTREAEIHKKVRKTVSDMGGSCEDADITVELLDKIMELSRKRQKGLIDDCSD